MCTSLIRCKHISVYTAEARVSITHTLSNHLSKVRNKNFALWPILRTRHIIQQIKPVFLHVSLGIYSLESQHTKTCSSFDNGILFLFNFEQVLRIFLMSAKFDHGKVNLKEG